MMAVSGYITYGISVMLTPDILFYYQTGKRARGQDIAVGKGTYLC